MSRRWLLSALVTGVLVGTGAAGGPAHAMGPAHAIAHGTDAQDGQFPFSVKLTMTGIPEGNGQERDSSCSGGLISPRWVLTAGHCFRDVNGKHVSRLVADKTTATVGRADLHGTRGQVATVIKVKQSPVADVALAQLDKPITGIAPMRLNRKAPKVGQILRLTGFGLLDGDDTEVTDRMQIGMFTISSVNKYEMGVTGKSPRKDTSACEHDSGGPYFVPDSTSAVVFGVVSHGPDCPHTGPDRSGRVDTVATWILGIIGRDGPPPIPKPTRTTTKTAPAKTGRAQSPPQDQSLKSETTLPYGMSLPILGGLAVLVAGIVFAATRRRGRNDPDRWRHRRR